MSSMDLGGSGRIFQDIRGLADVFLTKGSPAGPQELRTEAGVLYTFDLEPLLRRQLGSQDVVVSANLVSPALNTIVGLAFSLPGDHVLKAAALEPIANFANMSFASLAVQPFGDPNVAPLFQWTAGGAGTVVVDTAGTGLTFVRETLAFGELPMPIRRETDYIFGLGTNAGGGATVRAVLFVDMVQEGTGW